MEETKPTLESAISKKVGSKGSENSKKEDKYLTLKILSPLLKIVSWIALILSIVLLIRNSNDPSIESGAEVIPIYGIIGSLTLMAYAELLKVFCDIEKNTRKET